MTQTAVMTASEIRAQIKVVTQQIDTLTHRRADLERVIAMNWSGDTTAEALEHGAIPPRLAAAALVLERLAADLVAAEDAESFEYYKEQTSDLYALRVEIASIDADSAQHQKALIENNTRREKLNAQANDLSRYRAESGARLSRKGFNISEVNGQFKPIPGIWG